MTSGRCTTTSQWNEWSERCGHCHGPLTNNAGAPGGYEWRVLPCGGARASGGGAKGLLKGILARFSVYHHPQPHRHLQPHTSTLLLPPTYVVHAPAVPEPRLLGQGRIAPFLLGPL
jgi:hypothetical protein